MKQWIFPIIVVLLIAGYFIGRHLYFKPNYGGGEVAPNFSGVSHDGFTFELNDLKGQYVLLDFWGSWCGDCRKAHPGLVDLYDTFNGKEFKDASGFEVVSVALEVRENGAWQRAIQKDRLHWKYHTVEYFPKGGKMDDTVLGKEYGITWLPTSFLLSPSGEIIGVRMSKDELKKFLTEKLKDS